MKQCNILHKIIQHKTNSASKAGQSSRKSDSPIYKKFSLYMLHLTTAGIAHDKHYTKFGRKTIFGIIICKYKKNSKNNHCESFF